MNSDKTFKLGGQAFESRLLVGTGKFSSVEVMLAAIKASGAQLVTVALKRYVSKNERNIDLLYNYARQFRIQKIIRQYIEVLL